jgi:broad specificity phosphatase PhoE
MRVAPFRMLFPALLAGAATAAIAQPLPEADLVKALRAGGLVVIVRHGATYADQADVDPLHVDQPGNEAKQRHLNDKGRAAARAWNEAIKRMGIRVGKVYSSKFQRAQETARLAFGEPQTTFDLSEGGLVVSSDENKRRAQAMRKMAGTAPEPGTNTFIVTHRPNLMDAFGKDWFDAKEGEASVFRPDGKGGFQTLGRIVSERWSSLAEKYPK